MAFCLEIITGALFGVELAHFALHRERLGLLDIALCFGVSAILQRMRDAR